LGRGGKSFEYKEPNPGRGSKTANLRVVVSAFVVSMLKEKPQICRGRGERGQSPGVRRTRNCYLEASVLWEGTGQGESCLRSRRQLNDKIEGQKGTADHKIHYLEGEVCTKKGGGL